VKLIVAYMDVDKAFKLHLSLSPEIALSDYVEIITSLNGKANL
jgi:hypothetical protein